MVSRSWSSSSYTRRRSHHWRRKRFSCVSCEDGRTHHVIAPALEPMAAVDMSIPAQVFGHRRDPRYRFPRAVPAGSRFPATTGLSIAVSDGIHATVHTDTIVVPDHDPVVAPADVVLDALRRAHRRGARIVSVSIGGLRPGPRGSAARARHHPAPAGGQAAGRGLLRGQVDPEVLSVDHGDIATSAGVAAGRAWCPGSCSGQHPGCDVRPRRVELGGRTGRAAEAGDSLEHAEFGDIHGRSSRCQHIVKDGGRISAGPPDITYSDGADLEESSVSPAAWQRGRSMNVASEPEFAPQRPCAIGRHASTVRFDVTVRRNHERADEPG